VGANWKDKINVGDRVALEMGIPCGKPDCEECLSGGYNGCKCSSLRATAALTHKQAHTLSSSARLLTMAPLVDTMCTQVRGCTSCLTTFHTPRGHCVSLSVLRWLALSVGELNLPTR
jgi:threonine dehydrogenase-like Zn-dependent dehydrogenase